MIDEKLKEIQRMEIQFFSIVLRSTARSMYAAGEIPEEVLHNKKEFVKRVVHELSIEQVENLIIDHRSTLRKHSEYFLEKDEIHISKIFLATQIEHTLNALVINYCEKNGLSQKTAKEIIRSTQLKHKTGWLLEVFNFPKIPSEHLKIISRLADERNSFVHYKWTPLNHGFLPKDDIPEKDELSIEEILPTVEYIMDYEEKIRFNGNLQLIEETFKDVDHFYIQKVVPPEIYKKFYSRLRNLD